MSDKVILHADVNNFYASVATLLNPTLTNRSIIVCGDPDKRHGIVLAKSNLAKKYGIKTGDTIFEALRKCPDTVVLPTDFKQYMYFSNKIYNIYKDYTPYVESFGLDECWLDVSGVRKLFGDGETIANLIRERIKKEVGLTISVGVSFTKIFAKLGSDLKKPDAVTVISRENYKDIVWRLPVSEMIFVGESVRKKLNQMSIFTLGELAKADKVMINSVFGAVGERLYDSANGIENTVVKEYNASYIPESVSNGTTTEEDIRDIRQAKSVIYSLCEIIAARLREYQLKANGVSLSIKDSELKSFTRQTKLLYAADDAQSIAETALNILYVNYDFSQELPLRSLTVGTYNLMRDDAGSQLTLFDGENEKTVKIEKEIDNIRSKFGFGAVKRAIVINPHYTCDSREVDDGYLPFDKAKNSAEDKDE